MRSVPFDYERPPSLQAAVECLQVHRGSARLLAGGQTLLPQLHRRAVRPGVLVDLAGVPGLRQVAEGSGALRVGALTTHRDLERAALDHACGWSALAGIAAGIGDVAVRTRGTVGGTLALAGPTAQWCVLTHASDATVTVTGPDGVRRLNSGDFFDGGHPAPGGGPSAVGPHDIVTEVEFPPLPRVTTVRRSTVRPGPHGTVAVAVLLRLDRDGALAGVRIAVGGVGERIVRPRALEGELAGRGPDRAAADRIDAELTAVLAEEPDHGPDRDQRIRVAGRLVARAVAGPAAPGPRRLPPLPPARRNRPAATVAAR